MPNKIISAVAAALALATPAFAQELTGASVSGVYHSFDDSNLNALKGGADISLGGAFALGGNVAIYNSDDLDDTGFNGTAHLMYNLTPTSAVGLFIARDVLDDEDFDTYGIEVGFGSENGRFELYFGSVDGFDDADGVDRSIGGISIEFGVGQNIFLTLDSDAMTISDDGDSASIGTASLGARYQFAAGPSVFVEFGNVSVSASDGDTFVVSDGADFIGIGAEMTFGRASGNLLSNRSIFETIGF